MTDTLATDTIEQDASPSGFMAGLIAGGIIGAVFALAFAPRAGADLRRSVAGAAKDLGAEAAKRYQDVRQGMSDAVTPFVDATATAGAAKE